MTLKIRRIASEILYTTSKMKITGHRGAKALAPENTVASLLKAIEHGVDEVEFDVRVTSDGVPILHHNSVLTDRSGTRLKVATSSLKQLRAHKADLATLEDAAKAINRRVPMIIELKPGLDDAAVVKAIKALLRKGWQPTDMLIISRHQRLLRPMHQALPDIGIGVIESWSGVRATWRARQVGAKRLYMNHWWLWPGFIRAMSRQGWQLHAYTLNNPVRARKWAKHGLSGVVTDFPDRYEA